MYLTSNLQLVAKPICETYGDRKRKNLNLKFDLDFRKNDKQSD